MTLPLTLPVVAGIKTAIDVNTRKPLTNFEMEALINNLKKLDQRELYKLILKIVSTPGSSSSSKMLVERFKLEAYGRAKFDAESCRKTILEFIQASKNAGKNMLNVIYESVGFLSSLSPNIERLTNTKEHRVLLYLIFILGVKNQKLFNKLNMELWLLIINQIVSLKKEEFQEAFYFVSHQYLRAQLKAYNGVHHEHALSLAKYIAYDLPGRKLKAIVDDQYELLQGNNPYSKEEQNRIFKLELENKTTDRYHHIIGFWKQALPTDVTKEEKRMEVSKPRFF